MMRSPKLLALHGFGWGVMVFLAIPIVVIVPLSFSSGLYLQFPPPGWSTRWYAQVEHDSRWLSAASLSVQVALVATFITIVLGLAASQAIVGGQLRRPLLFYFLVMAPLIVPQIITAVAVYFFFSSLSVTTTAVTIGLIHALVCLPPFVIIVSASLRGFDQRLKQAAISLGATPWVAFRRVTLRLIAPAVMAGAVLAFLTSFDEVVIALMLAGPQTETLPVVIWDSMQLELDPSVTAVSTVLIIMTITGMILSGLFLGLGTSRRRGKLSRRRRVGGASAGGVVSANTLATKDR